MERQCRKWYAPRRATPIQPPLHFPSSDSPTPGYPERDATNHRCTDARPGSVRVQVRTLPLVVEDAQDLRRGLQGAEGVRHHT